MTEKIKTRSEVSAELEAAVKLINNDNSDCNSLRVEKDKLLDQLWVINANRIAVGNAHPYTPEPDTKEQALDKAKNEAFEQLCNGRHVSPIRYSDGAIVFFSGPEHYVSHKHKFIYAGPTTSPECITDEPPPEGVVVEIKCDDGSNVLRYSTGKFDEHKRKFLLVTISNRSSPMPRKTYRSLTTPHRSKDWED